MSLTLVVVILLAVALLPSALNIPQSNPNTVPEYAPVPPDEDSSSEDGNLAALGQAGGSTLSRGGGQSAGVIPTGGGQKRSGKRCVGDPPRQSEDPMSPPCVAFFEGNNGGVTGKGITGDEITIVLYISGNFGYNNGSGGLDWAETRSICDVDKPPNSGGPSCYARAGGSGGSNTQRDHIYVQAARPLARHFNNRFQTYDRHGHVYIYWSDATSEEMRRAEAADIDARLKPFAVVDLTNTGGFQESFSEAVGRRKSMAFSTLPGLRASFFQRTAPYLWGFRPDIEHWANGYVGYACKKIAPFNVSHATGGRMRDGSDMNGKPRRYGFMSTSDPSQPGLRAFRAMAGERLKECRIDPVTEVFFPRSGSAVDTGGDSTYATKNVAQLQGADVTTILWFGGMESKTGQAADQIGYYPEIVIAGDGSLDGNTNSRFQHPQFWRNAWGYSTELRQDTFESSPQYQACREGDPSAPTTACNYATQIYRPLFMVFNAIQSAGPRLTVHAVDRGLHAIQRYVSSSPYVAACYYDPGDYTCVKDGMELWWDGDGTAPNGVAGCYRLVKGGLRFPAEEWPSKDEAFANPRDPCSGYEGGVIATVQAPSAPS